MKHVKYECNTCSRDYQNELKLFEGPIEINIQTRNNGPLYKQKILTYGDHICNDCASQMVARIKSHIEIYFGAHLNAYEAFNKFNVKEENDNSQNPLQTETN